MIATLHSMFNVFRRKNSIRILLFPVLGCCFSLSAGVITIDADPFADGTDISNSFLPVSLSAIGDYSGHDGKVYVVVSADLRASTLPSIFGNSWWLTPRDWGMGENEATFKASFPSGVNSIQIDVVGSDASDYGRIEAYSESDELLDFEETQRLGTAEIATIRVSSLSTDISYILAGGIGGDTVHLDNLRYTSIPEPSSLLLLIFCSYYLLLKQRRKIL